MVGQLSEFMMDMEPRLSVSRVPGPTIYRVLFSSPVSLYVPTLVPFFPLYVTPLPVSLLQSVASYMLSDRVFGSAQWSLCSVRLDWLQEVSLDNTESAPGFVQERNFCLGQRVPPVSGHHGQVSQH